MKKCLLPLLFLLCLLPSLAFAMTEEEWNRTCGSVTTAETPYYELTEWLPSEEYSGLYPVFVQVGTVPAGKYYWYLGRGVSYPVDYHQIKYWDNGSTKIVWIKNGGGTTRSAKRTIYLSETPDFKTISFHSINEIIFSNPDERATYIAEHWPGYYYSFTPPLADFQLNESTTQVPINTPMPGASTDEATATPAATPAATPKPTSGSTAATKPASTKKPSSTKRVTATATPTPAPASAIWLSAGWLAEHVDPACTEDRQVTLLRLGLVDCDIALAGTEYTVPTQALTFAEGVKDEHRIAAIYAPKTGKGTLRKAANEKSAKLKTCKAGVLVYVLEYRWDWTKICYDGQVGYIKTAVLTFPGERTETLGEGVASYQRKATGRTTVPVRNRKANDAAIVTKLRTATAVTVLSFDGIWYEIEHDGWYGFLHKNYFTYGEE